MNFVAMKMLHYTTEAYMYVLLCTSSWSIKELAMGWFLDKNTLQTCIFQLNFSIKFLQYFN